MFLKAPPNPIGEKDQGGSQGEVIYLN